VELTDCQSFRRNPSLIRPTSPCYNTTCMYCKWNKPKHSECVTEWHEAISGRPNLWAALNWLCN